MESLKHQKEKIIMTAIKTHLTKINSKWIKDLNIRPETIKLLENIGKTLSDINHSRILYDPPPRILEIKAKINKWDLIKIKIQKIFLKKLSSASIKQHKFKKKKNPTIHIIIKLKMFIGKQSKFPK